MVAMTTRNLLLEYLDVGATLCVALKPLIGLAREGESPPTVSVYATSPLRSLSEQVLYQ